MTAYGWARGGAAVMLGALALAGSAWADDGAWTVEAAYTADVTGVLDGGEDRAGRFLDNLDIVVDGDLERAVGWRGARVRLYLLNNSGGQPNDLIGTLQGIDNIEVARPRARLYELWVEQSFGERAALLVGLYDLNSEFYATEAADLFIAPPFGIGSEFAATGPNGPSIFPSTSLAARLRLGKAAGTSFQAAVLNADARTLGDPDGVATNLDEGVLFIAEAAWRAPFRIAAGAWAYGERQDDIRDLDPFGQPRQSRARGVYALAEGALWEAGDRALRGFVRVGASDGDTSPFDGGWQAGLRLDGVVAGRPDSAIGVGVHQGFLSDKHRANGADAREDLGSAESGLEVTIADTFGRVTVQPDLQLIHNPGGDRRADVAVVGALRLTVDLSPR